MYIYCMFPAVNMIKFVRKSSFQADTLLARILQHGNVVKALKLVTSLKSSSSASEHQLREKRGTQETSLPSVERLPFKRVPLLIWLSFFPPKAGQRFLYSERSIPRASTDSRLPTVNSLTVSPPIAGNITRPDPPWTAKTRQ